MDKDKYKLFESCAGAKIAAYIRQPFLWDARNITAYQVAWPSIGMVPVEDARQFAASIVEACDWLEAQKEAANANQG